MSIGTAASVRRLPPSQEMESDMATSAADAPLAVSTDGTAGPYVIVNPDQYGPVAEALRAEGVRFHVDQDAVLIAGKPALAIIDLGLEADLESIQRILDRVSGDLREKRRRGQERNGHALCASLFPAGEDLHSLNPFIARWLGPSGTVWVRQVRA